MARLVFEDGTVQFAENETYPDIVYSPQLPEPELEVFCGKHMAVYEQYFDENFEAMDRGMICRRLIASGNDGKTEEIYEL